MSGGFTWSLGTHKSLGFKMASLRVLVSYGFKS